VRSIVIAKPGVSTFRKYKHYHLQRRGYIYILTNKHKTVLYTGVTSNLRNRIFDHKEKKYVKSFTSRYNADILIYYERFQSIADAIQREKQLKSGSRLKKEELINRMNPGWNDLFDRLEF
jgi:putative endonuclease